MKNVTILLIEDLPFEKKIIAEEFSKNYLHSYKLLTIDRFDQIQDILLHKSVDLVIVDLNVQECTGIEAFEKIQTRFSTVPVIALTENNDETCGVKVIRQGAQDYLTKRERFEKHLPHICYTAIEKYKVQRSTKLPDTFLRSTLNALPSAITIVDSDIKIVMVNTAWSNLAARLSAPREDDWIGLDYLSCGIGINREVSDLSTTIPHNIRMVLNGKCNSFETDYLRYIKGKVRWFQFRVTPFTDLTAKYAIIEHEDITCRKEKESELQTSGDYLRLVFDTTPNLVFVKNTSGHYLMANKALMELLGIPKDTRIDLNGFSLSPDEYEQFNQFESCFSNQIDYSNISDKRSKNSEGVIDKNGEKRHFRFLHQPIDFPNAQPGILTIGLDITELRQSQKEIQQSQNRLQTILDAMHQSIVFYDAEMRAIWANISTTDEMLSYPSEVIGQTCTEIWHEKSGGQSCVLCRARKNKTIQEEIVEMDNGRYTRLTGCPVIDSAGSVTGVVSIEEDISQIQSLEKQLRQAQKMESLGTLAGGIAHDFNNILTAIMGFTELSLGQLDKGRNLRESLVEVHKASIRARDLVHQILTFSRRVEQQLHPLDISLVAREALKLLRASLPATITIESQISKNIGLVLADPTQIHQIIMNLVTNAAHSMSDNGGDLRVSLQPVELVEKMKLAKHQKLPPGQYTQLKITDTGTGIPPDHISSIFEPYFTTKEHGEGTGLGLAVVHGIVKEYGGDIAVSSELNTGTTFTILFPQFEGKDQHSGKPMLEKTIRKGQGEQILVVDDEAAIGLLCKRLLQKEGYKVSREQDPQKVLSGIQDGSITADLLLTDMTMPQVTGEKLAQEFRQKNSTIPIIIMSGNVSKLSRGLEEDDLVRLIGKPLERDYLLRNIAEMIENNNTFPEATADDIKH